MIILTVKDVTKRYGDLTVLNGVSFDLRAGERVGLVGPNGSGKTTLFDIVGGRGDADFGETGLQRNTSIGYLEQQVNFDPQTTVWNEARSAFGELLDLIDQAENVAGQLARAAIADRNALGRLFDDLQQDIDRLGGYQLDHKVQRILQGLGFRDTEFNRPVGQLSGGQQNRLFLAKLLLSEPDILLLDEPSNHLDIEATQWLEEYLTTTRSAVVVVSHDRYLLDKVSERTLELFWGRVDSYKGDFSAYWRQKAERLETQRRTYERQQAEITRMEDFVRRNRYGQKHAQAEDRKKKLDRIERVDPPREIMTSPMGFPPAQRSGDLVLRVEHLSKAYDQQLFEDLTFTIQRGEKWGILGPNASGKTTLLRCVIGQITPDSGRVILGAGVTVAYFDQQLSHFMGSTELLEAVRVSSGESTYQQRRDLLARFGLAGDVVHQRVDTLSGGQRNRAALARLSAEQANLLVLDEPTNHLDLWARDALEESLDKFDGSVLLVSHDRYFLNRVVDHLLVVEPSRMRVIEGNYDMYLQLKDSADRERKDSLAEKRETEQMTAESERRKTLKHRRQFPYRKVEDIEREIAEREVSLEELHALLASPNTLRDGQRVKQIKAEIVEQKSDLEALYKHWDEAVELN